MRAWIRVVVALVAVSVSTSCTGDPRAPSPPSWRDGAGAKADGFDEVPDEVDLRRLLAPHATPLDNLFAVFRGASAPRLSGVRAERYLVDWIECYRAGAATHCVLMSWQPGFHRSLDLRTSELVWSALERLVPEDQKFVLPPGAGTEARSISAYEFDCFWSPDHGETHCKAFDAYAEYAVERMENPDSGALVALLERVGARRHDAAATGPVLGGDGIAIDYLYCVGVAPTGAESCFFHDVASGRRVDVDDPRVASELSEILTHGYVGARRDTRIANLDCTGASTGGWSCSWDDF